MVSGQVLLDKNKHIQSVVNKTETIDNTYRNFKMELLAGVDDMNVTVKENGCLFQFDFSKVYWNSRLGENNAVSINWNLTYTACSLKNVVICFNI